MNRVSMAIMRRESIIITSLALSFKGITSHGEKCNFLIIQQHGQGNKAFVLRKEIPVCISVNTYYAATSG
jgi:hypothetical protein